MSWVEIYERRRLDVDSEVQWITIYQERDDGEDGVIATFNNTDGYFTQAHFIQTVNEFYAELMKNSDLPESLHWAERQDTPDYVYLDDAEDY